MKKLIIVAFILILNASDERYNKEEIKEDISKAFSWIQAKTKAGVDYAKDSYDEFQTDNNGKKLTKKQQLNKLNKLAKEGSAKAQYYLGLAYLHAKDSYKNRDKIYDSFEKSAKNGYAKSQFELGKLYFKGLNIVKKDDKKAKYWLNKAYLNGSKEAKTYIDKNNLK